MSRIRLSTVVLIIAFLAAWWVYETNRVEPAKPAPQVAPPGFMPDPNYMWVPRTPQPQAPATVTVTVTITPPGGRPAPISPPPAR